MSISRRYEHAPTVLTSQYALRGVGRNFRRCVTPGALIDRLVHRRHIVNIRGDGYRLRHHHDLAAAHAEPPSVAPT